MQRIAIAIGAFLWASNLVQVGAQDQIPFPATGSITAPAAPIPENWSFTDPPHANSTAQLVFSTVHNLLQHWPNTRYRNGHTVIPGVVPAGTLLYHGSYEAELPTTPEWIATDPDHAYVFCAAVSEDSGCWHATLIAKRPLRVLYFDGSSAAKMEGGSMDSQDILIWGEVRPDKTFDEPVRIAELCKWGKKHGLDGFARMELDFELMICDFTSGLETVSVLNLASPAFLQEDVRPRTPSKSSASSIFRYARVEQSQMLSSTNAPESPLAKFQRIGYRSIEAGHWHNYFPGESRIQPDYTRLISFYDPVTAPSLVRAREGQNRLQHRLDALSKEDSKRFRERLEGSLADTGGGSGVDWSTLFNVITQRFAERLELLAYILNATDVSSITEEAAEERLQQAHRHIGSMLVFYIVRSDLPPSPESLARDPANHTWAASVFQACATTHTRYLNASVLARGFTASETLLSGAVKGVQKEICRVLVGLWAEGAEVGLDYPEGSSSEVFVRSSSKSSSDQVREWTARVEGLMAWLDWSYWLRCRPACSYEETCYMTTWPFIKHPWGPGPPPGSTTSKSVIWGKNVASAGEGGEDEDGGDWSDPKPKCIRRVEPFLGLEIPELPTLSNWAL